MTDLDRFEDIQDLSLLPVAAGATTTPPQHVAAQPLLPFDELLLVLDVVAVVPVEVQLSS